MFALRQVIIRNSRSMKRSFVSATNVRSTEVLATPTPEGLDGPANPKLLNLVNEIAKLNLLEVSELSTLLKKTLNLPDAPVVSYGGPGPAAPVVEEEEAAAPQAIQTSFKLKINSYDTTKKIQLIKELKASCGMNLVEAKKFVEATPGILKDDLSRDEAEALKAAVEKAGAVAEVQ